MYVIFFYNLTLSQTTGLDTQPLPQVVGCLAATDILCLPSLQHVLERKEDTKNGNMAAC
jgi:hypothetical protein